MPPIHVEPDQLYLTSHTFFQANYHALEDLYALRSALLRLEMTWTSPSAEAFHHDMHALVQQLDAQIEQLVEMGLVLSRQADRWQESDQRWMAAFRELLFNWFGG